MDHAQARALSSTAVDEPLGCDDERELVVHLVQCPECKSFYDGIGETRSVLAGPLQSGPPADVLDHTVVRATTVLTGEADPGPLGRVPEEPPTGDIPLPAATWAHTSELDSPVAVVGEPAPTEESVPPDEPAGEPEAVAGLPAVPPPPREPDGGSGLPDVEVVDHLPFEDLPPSRLPFRERRAMRRDARGVRPTRRARVLLAILAAGGLAVLAATLVTHHPSVRRRPATLPSASEVRRKVDSAFDGLRTLQVSWTGSRLGLYRQGPQKVLFVQASERGRLVFQAPGSFRDEYALSVPGGPQSKVTAASDGAEVRTLTENSATSTLATDANTAFGPPDGALHGHLGTLEPRIGAMARLMSAALDLKVVRRTSHAGRPAYLVTFSVVPSDLTRADRIEALLDARTFVPLRIERSLARGQAAVLGPDSLLTPAALDAAFAGRNRVTTETVDVTSLAVNGSIRAGEFLVTAAPGTQQSTADDGWQSVPKAGLRGRLPFTPMFPAALPLGFREAGFAVFAGPKPPAWGPRGSYPLPDAIMQGLYSDGKVSLVVSERHFRGRHDPKGSPLATTDGLPIDTLKTVRGGQQLFYGASPDVSPHVWGWSGDVLVVVSGYVSEDDLLRVAASLLQPLPSPSFVGSPAPSSPPSPSAAARRVSARL